MLMKYVPLWAVLRNTQEKHCWTQKQRSLAIEQRQQGQAADVDEGAALALPFTLHWCILTPHSCACSSPLLVLPCTATLATVEQRTIMLPPSPHKAHSMPSTATLATVEQRAQ